MKILGIDTTRKSAKIYIANDDSNYVENIDDKIKHSEGLFLYLEKSLLINKLELKDFDYFCGIVGPGSFTGIRVGMSVIKGFAKALNKKVITLNTFEIVKNHIKNGIMLLNSTIANCYYADIKNGQVVDAGIIEKSNLLNKFDKTIYILEEEQNSIELEYDNIKIISNISDLYFDALNKKIESGDFGVFEPYYLQLSQAERNLNE